VANLPLAFAELLGGGVLLTAGLTGASIQDVFAGNISVPALDVTPAAAPSPGGGQPAGGAQVRAWVAQGLALAYQHTGDPRLKPTQANINTVSARAMQESSGNPRAINLWDSNAKAGHPSQGLLQTIPSTFNAHAVPGHTDITNPVDNTAAAVIYMVDQYGHLVGAGQGGY